MSREVRVHEVGARIREARQARGWSQQQLADAVNTTQSAVSLYENGQRGCAVETLVDIARAVNRPVTWFLGWEIVAFAPDTPAASLLAELDAHPELVGDLLDYWKYLKGRRSAARSEAA